MVIKNESMTKQQAIQLFEQKQVRTIWDDEQEKWYFPIVDVVLLLLKNWSILKEKSEPINIHMYKKTNN